MLLKEDFEYVCSRCIYMVRRTEQREVPSQGMFSRTPRNAVQLRVLEVALLDVGKCVVRDHCAPCSRKGLRCFELFSIPHLEDICNLL